MGIRAKPFAGAVYLATGVFCIPACLRNAAISDSVMPDIGWFYACVAVLGRLCVWE
jgi:hypothetical protein